MNGTCTGGSGSGGATGSGGTTGTGGSGSGGTSPTGGTTGSGGSGSGGTTGTGGTGTTNQPVLVTSAANAYWKTNGTLTTVTSGTATVTVNDSTTKQTWEGFGGAFNEMGWNYIQMLSASDQTKALDLLFGTDAAHFGIGRIPIGASDYALPRYTDDETSGDTSLMNFSTTEDAKYLIPYVQAAQKVNSSLRFWASPWTPPTWMKTFTGSDSNGTACKLVGSTNFDGGCMNATTANLTAFAQLPLEVGHGVQRVWDQDRHHFAAERAELRAGLPVLPLEHGGLRHLRKGGAGDGVPDSGSTKIMLGTMSNGDNGATSFDLKVVQGVEADPTAKTIPKVMGLQWGMLDLDEGATSGIGPSNFMTGSLPVWATEHKCGNYPWITTRQPPIRRPAQTSRRTPRPPRPTIRPTASSPGPTSATRSPRVA